jgi:hypothetical protein
MRSRIRNEKHMQHRDKKESKDNLPLPPFNSPLTKGGHRGVKGGEGGLVGEINTNRYLDIMCFSSSNNSCKVH